MTLSWSGRRQLLYYGVAFVILGFGAWGAYQTFFTAAPTCFDGKQNGTEHGVDCGGTCSLVCSQDTRPLVVLWSRAFEVAPPSSGSGQGGTYTAAAYVQNPNTTAGAKSVHYAFQLFDDTNSLVLEQGGTIDLPPVQTIPIVETNINTGTRSVSHALFAFADTPMVWKTPAAPLPVLRVGNQTLASDGSQLTATLTNDTLTDAGHVVVDAVLFDQGGIARAASKSVMSVPKSSQQVVFTWPQGIPNIVRAEIIVLPAF